ncbi:MAG: hypothetical protein LQ346_009115 [Caloplaca aetnensis]|nr:MAG: hypothetical protein LQ346_009115 [Caloplaca aetnensis]
MILPPPPRARPLRTNTTSSNSTTASSAANALSYPAAAAHYVTSRGFGGYNNGGSSSSSSNNNVDGASEGPTRSKKEELWLQRWARAKRILEREGVVLKSWRVGGDVMGKAVGLVEKAVKEGGERSVE